MVVLSWRVAGLIISTTVISENSISVVFPASKTNDKSLTIELSDVLNSENDAPVFLVTPEILPHKTISNTLVLLTCMPI